MAKNHHTVGFSLPQDQIRELERLAVEQRRPKSYFVQQALADFFAKLRSPEHTRVIRETANAS